MKKKSLMELFIYYIKENIKYISSLILFSGIFLLVFQLNNIDLNYVLYALLLCISTLLVFSLCNFYFYVMKYKKLEATLYNVFLTMDGLPEPKTLNEKKYTEIINEMYNNNRKTVSEFDKEKSELIDYYTMWVHQVKTPIAAMKLIAQNSDNAYSRDLLAELFQIEQYVNMVLTYVRMNNDKTDFVIKKYDIDKIIRESVKKFSSQFIRKKISLDFKETNVNVLTDEKWLSFIIEQVISNSLKYTKKGTISIYSTDENTICIEDTGIGIAPEDLPRVFDNGFTGYNGRSDKKATGIGLFMCKKIAEKLSHSISIESKINEGTKIFLCFQINNLNTDE